jgi:S-layer homology domain
MTRRYGRVGALAGLGSWVFAATMTALPVETYGTAGTTSYTVSALEFSTYIQGEAWNPVLGTAARYLLSPLGEFVAAVHLPQGASIESVEIEGCDNSASGSLTGSFFSVPAPAGAPVDLADFDTGIAATPGCGVFPVAVSPPVTVDNPHNVYFFQLSNSPGDDTTYFAAVRVNYRLQISAAPATSDFNDVPTSHPFFREIEALFKAGITSGCGGGNFCPDNPLTRAQAAALFSRALGLYWPN